MVMGGFSIDELLAPKKKDQKDQKNRKDQKNQKDSRSNYHRNLSHAPYSAFGLSFSDSPKVGLLSCYDKNVLYNINNDFSFSC